MKNQKDLLLSVRGLSVYYGAVQALLSVDLDIPRGQIISIVGANGAGKSTLLKAISGMIPVRSGEILFEGRLLPTASNSIVRAGITHVPEGRKVFAGLSVEENLVMGGYSRKASEAAKVQEEMFALFPILKSRRKQQAGTLSGGEQQMLAIARGLMSKPKLLLLDEPSLGLAPIIVKQVFALIQQVRDMGYTLLLVEQNANIAMTMSDFTYVLENGKICLSGPSDELLKKEEIIAAYLGEKQADT